MGMKDATDGDLVRRARGGEAAAFAELCRRHGSRARTLARRVLGADAEAEDVVQDALLAAFAGLARLRDPERFGGWLYAIAVNLARMRVRARHPDGALAPAAAAPTPEEAVEQTERARLVRSAFAALSDGEQRVVFLHYFGGHGCAEIGAMLGLTEGAVRVRLHRARGRLRSELEFLRPKEAPAMVEMAIEKVLVRAAGATPPGDEALRVVLLRERDGARRLPIWIGRPDGDALAVRVAEQQTPRPLTIDLTAGLLAAAGVEVQRVTVNRLAERTFHAVVSLANAGDVDARPSDALNLALRVGAPVHVAAELDDREQALGYAGGEPWRELEGREVVAAWEAQRPK
jgi:RNA polymerase sigma-70 factor (ECF subfamily)